MIKLPGPIGRVVRSSFFRFLCVGVVNTLIGYSFTLIFYNLVFWGLGAKNDYWVSSFLANNILGATVSYFLNKRFTFDSKGQSFKSIFRFYPVLLVCYFIAYFAAEKLVTWIIDAQFPGMNEKLVGNISLFSAMVLYTLLNYFGQKYLVFQKKKAEKA